MARAVYRGRHLAALALFILLTLMLTWPLAHHLGTKVLGPPQDNYYYLSWLGWFRHTLLDLRAPSTLNPYVFYPFGHDFATSETTWANVALVLPVLIIWGEVVAFNVGVLLSFILAAFGTYLLVSELTGSWLAGLLAGIIYGFSPYRMAHLGGGHLSLLGTQWVPFCIWALERWLRERRWAWGLALGLFYSLLALSSWYYAFMGGLLLPIYFLARAWPWRRCWRERYLWAGLIGAVVVASILVIPAILPTLKLSEQEAMSYSLQWVDRWSASIADYLLPNPLQTIWGAKTTRFYAGERFFYERILALGYVPLILTAVALRRGKKGAEKEGCPPTVAALLWVGGIAFVLSLGTTLHWRTVEPVHIPVPAGVDRLFDRVMYNLVTRFSLNRSAYYWAYQRAGHIVLPLPAMFFYLYVPFSNTMRVWARFGLFVSFVTAVLAGKGLTELMAATQAATRRSGGVLLGLVCLAFALFECWVAPFPYGISEVKMQPQSEWLRALPGKPVVMELPLTRALNGPPLYAALYHGKPIAYGYGTFFPAKWVAKWDVLASFPSQEALDTLRSWGVRYILLASANYGDRWPEIERLLQARGDIREVAVFQEEELYQNDRWFIATRGTALPFVADKIYVYELY